METVTRDSIFARALEYPMQPVISRYAKDKSLPLSVAQEHERELKRFLSLCALNRDAAYGMAGPVDDLWHTFILFTKEYAAFCDSVAGMFLHHIPNTKPTKDTTSYEAFLSAYEQIYGEEAPRHIWPRFGSHKQSNHLDCEGSGCGRCSKCSNCTGVAISCKACDGCGQGSCSAG